MAEEFNGLIHSHVEHVVDVLSAIFHFKRVGAVAFAMARFAFQRDVSHELHLNGDCAFAFAVLAASAGGVERKIAGVVAHLLRQLLLGKEVANFVECFQIGCRVAARRFAYRVLVDVFNCANHIHVALNTEVCTRSIDVDVEPAGKCAI